MSPILRCAYFFYFHADADSVEIFLAVSALNGVVMPADVFVAVSTGRGAGVLLNVACFKEEVSQVRRLDWAPEQLPNLLGYFACCFWNLEYTFVSCPRRRSKDKGIHPAQSPNLNVIENI